MENLIKNPRARTICILIHRMSRSVVPPHGLGIGGCKQYKAPLGLFPVFGEIAVSAHKTMLFGLLSDRIEVIFSTCPNPRITGMEKVKRRTP